MYLFIRLSRPLVYSVAVQPIPLPAKCASLGTNCQVTGWFSRRYTKPICHICPISHRWGAYLENYGYAGMLTDAMLVVGDEKNIFFWADKMQDCELAIGVGSSLVCDGELQGIGHPMNYYWPPRRV